jgi:signal recognition particle subunit SRP54
MLEIISNGFSRAKDRFQGRIEITESNIEDALKDIRISLLEADVNYSVVNNFISEVKEKAIGEIVQTRVAHKGQKLKTSPAQHFINICYKELVSLMGPVDTTIKFSSRPVSSIMLIGLQGCGKTTTAGKIANYLTKKNKKPLLVAADTYRPAAIEQLQVIGSSLSIPVYSEINSTPALICSNAMKHAAGAGYDVVILDTAGRLAIDDSLMNELETIASNNNPENIFLVCDAMIGQDAVKTAEEFNKRLDISGFILTKLDGDARGGSALSIKKITGKPIKFVCTGESFDRLEEFRPEGIASRILGFGDVVGLMQDFEEVIDDKKAEEEAFRMLKGQFTLIDFLKQIQALKKMGPLQDIVEKIPFFSQISNKAAVDDGELVKVESIINSMTPEERTNPDIIKERRKKRIACGSGRTIKDITEILKRFSAMRNMMKNMGRSGLLSKISGGLTNMPGLMGGSDFNNFNESSLQTGSNNFPKPLSSSQKRKIKSKRKKAKLARKKGRKK